MLEQLNKNDYNVLEYHFNNYCRMMYNKTYPLILNNLKKYLEQVVLFHYSNEFKINIQNLEWVEEDNELICISITEVKNFDTLFIRDCYLYNAGMMAIFNNSLKIVLLKQKPC